MTPPVGSKFIHDALLYGSDEELIRTAIPFLTEGLAAGESGLVVCRQRTIDLLTRTIGRHPRLRVLPQARVYQRITSAIRSYRELVRRELAVGAWRVRLVGEVDFGTTTGEWAFWGEYESVCNVVFARDSLWGLCLYDTRALPDEIVRNAELTHPQLVTSTGRGPNRRYLDPAEFVRQSAPAGLDRIQRSPPTFSHPDITDSHALRRHVHRAALAAIQLPTRTAVEFAYAMSEVATNAFEHGRRPVAVRMWVGPGLLVGTVTDHGPGFDDPLLGYVPPDNGIRGLGLWIARQLSDHIDITRTATTFTVRLVSGKVS